MATKFIIGRPSTAQHAYATAESAIAKAKTMVISGAGRTEVWGLVAVVQPKVSVDILKADDPAAVAPNERSIYAMYGLPNPFDDKP